MKYIVSFLFFISLFLVTHAQEVWTLNDCISYALENNISLKQSSLNTEYAKNTLLQNKMNLYTPNIQANASESFNFANSINPLTYQFVQQNTNSTSFSVGLNYNIFEGLSRIFTQKASKESLNATQYEQQALENQTVLLVINNYLSALLAKEALSIAKDKKLLTTIQKTRTEELISSGMLAKSNQYEVNAQLANDDLSVVNAENNYQTALNQLRLLLQLPIEQQIEIAPLDLLQDAKDAQLYNLNQVVGNALDALPDMKGLEYRRNAAELQIKATKGSLSPTLSFSAYMGTNYFSAAQEQTGSTNSVIPIGYVGSSSEAVYTLYEQPIYNKKGFGNQLKDNFNQNVQFSLGIPIFGKWQRMIAIDNAKLNHLKTSYDINNKENTIAQDVYSAYTNYTAAVKQLNASQENKSASEIAYNFGVEKLNAGVINSFEFETIKNRHVSAQANYVQAKYELYFKQLILDYYNTGNFNY
ncbi:MAG: TolC family protein [Bacteroidetes bacterium]|nr:TolC family protein [Bacteroidota bacterium]